MPAVLHTLATDVWSLALVVFFFGGSIFVHELGHFLAARRRGVHVERFSIGFGPPIWSRRGKDGVEYCVAWFPFGGYVMLPQLADLGPLEGASSRTDLSRLPPLSYRTKMIVFAAGAFFNLLFAFALACVIWAVGQPQSNEDASTRIGYVLRQLPLSDGSQVPSPALQAGLQVGDRVLDVDGHRVRDWEDISENLVMGSREDESGTPLSVLTIERGGRQLQVTVHPRLSTYNKIRSIGISPWYNLIVAGYNSSASLGKNLGFRVGDEITGLDGRPMGNISDYADYLTAHRSVPVTADVRRGGRQIEIRIPPRTAPAGLWPLGVELTTGFKMIHPYPWTQLDDQVVLTFRTLASLINPHSDVRLSGMSGPVGIVHVLLEGAGSEEGLRSVILLTILINVNLAIINLLPIPVMDGGQMLMATIGRLRGRALPAELVMKTQSLFVVLLVTVFVYLTVFNIRDWVHDAQTAHPPPAAAAKP